MRRFLFVRWSMIFIFFILICLSGGCSREPEKKPVAPLLRIAVALSEAENDTVQVIRRIMEKRGKDEQIKIIWLDAKNDPQEQKRQLMQLLGNNRGQKADVVVFQPVAPSLCTRELEEMAKANIKVIALEKMIPNVYCEGYIAPDRVLAGQLQARYAIGQRGRPLKALLLTEDPADPGFQVVAREIRNFWGEDASLLKEIEIPQNDPEMVTANVLQAVREEVEVIFITGQHLVKNTLAALKSAGQTSRIITIGVGADKEAISEIVAGVHDAEIDIMPEVMAQHILDAALSLARTGHWQYTTLVNNGNYDIPARITPVRLIDRSNVYLLELRWGESRKKASGSQNPVGEEEKKQENNREINTENPGGSGGDKSRPEESQSGREPKLRITTQDGKVVEVEIPGEIKSIETLPGQKSAGDFKEASSRTYGAATLA